ncbi:hypothetical protein ACFVWR_18980, partial [Leifsonia sp. NPDC058292]|uniref:hypothetical protein n=1 Tax=Leifsonia sp. NPDC058292 TaxID=3346428 RepID=UPI0036D89978
MLYERFVSLSMILLWFTAGLAFLAVWYAVTGDLYPPLWVRIVVAALLFPALIPLEAALARRHERRKRGQI